MLYHKVKNKQNKKGRDTLFICSEEKQKQKTMEILLNKIQREGSNLVVVGENAIER